MNVLLELQKQRLKLSHISEKLDMTITEASRHLQRLSEARLIQKEVDGSYGLTHFGNLTLSLLSGWLIGQFDGLGAYWTPEQGQRGL